MAQSNRGFALSKMNKDSDERTVKDGEYRDALNIQVSSSDGSNIGSAQTLLGNTLISGNMVPTGSTVVGSIAHNKEDKVYYLVAGPKPSFSDYNTPGIWKDYIIEYDIKTESFKYVFVDIYQANFITTSSVTSRDIPVSFTGVSEHFRAARYEMSVDGYDGSGMQIITSDNVSNIEVISTNITGSTTGEINIYSSTQDFNSINTPSGTWLNLKSDRILAFEKDNYITGINIIDGMLFWTDNKTEPKKINIKRSIAGTGGSVPLPSVLGVTFAGDSADWHTRLCITPDKTNPLRVKPRNETEPWYVKEQNITVIRKGPTEPPILKMSRSEGNRAAPTYSQTDGSPNGICGTPMNPPTSTTYALNSFAVNPPGTAPDFIKKPGALLRNVFVLNPVDWRIGDMILFNQQEDIVSAEGFMEHDVRATVTSTPGGASTGPYNFEIQSLNRDDIDQEQKMWNLRLEGKKPMFEHKFVRFAFRYKYEDGEYSTYSPWSETAFMPGEYDYLPKKAYNLAMSNRLRSLEITNYLCEGHYGIYNDVIEIDLLYKNESDKNIYVVETLKMTDGWGVAGDDNLWPDRWKDWPVDDASLSKKRGSYKVTSELISKVVPGNQLLRQWDNVPRMAKAQEITSNRLVYGNYVQNFDLQSQYSTKEIKPHINVTISAKDAPLNDPDGTGYEDSFSLLDEPDNQQGNLEGFVRGVKTCRSLRTYQVGVVYGDKYGRETPVLASKDGAGSLTINVENSSTINTLRAWITTDVPDFASYYKYFVKETSNSYYNLAMDRWYNAEDGNIWISYASADRNKVDIENFIILKKKHDEHTPVTDLARYKIIAIENTAPKFIKTNIKVYGMARNNTGKTHIGTASLGFPTEFTNVLWVDKDAVDFPELRQEWGTVPNPSTGGSSSGSITDRVAQGVIYVRVRTKTIMSNWYQVVNIGTDSTQWYKIKCDKTFKKDVAFAGGAWANCVDDLRVEFASHTIEDKPQFEGRFFVKIHKDLILQKWLLSSKKKTYRVKAASKLHYLNIRHRKNMNNDFGTTTNTWEACGMNNKGELSSDTAYLNPRFTVNGVSVTNHGLGDQYGAGGYGNYSDANDQAFFFYHLGGGHSVGPFYLSTCPSVRGPRTWGSGSTGEFFIDGLIVRGTKDGCNSCGSFHIADCFFFGCDWCNCGVCTSLNFGGPRSAFTYKGGDSCSNCSPGDSRGRGVFGGGMKMDIGYIHSGNYNWGAGHADMKTQLTTKGTTFRFMEDPDQIVYQITGSANGGSNGSGPGKHHLHSSWSTGIGYAFGLTAAGNNVTRFEIRFEQVEMPGVGLPDITGGGLGGYHPLGGSPTTKIAGVAELGYWGGRHGGGGGTNLGPVLYRGDQGFGTTPMEVPTPPNYINDKVKSNASGASNQKISASGGTEDGLSGMQQLRKYRLHPTKFHNIEIVEEIPDDGDWSSKNPAVWETEPKEDIGMDIYYEASPAIPVDINAYTNERLAPIGSLVERYDVTSSLPSGPYVLDSWSDTEFRFKKLDGSAAPSFTIQSGDRFRFTRPDGFQTTIIVNTPPGSAPWPANITISNGRLTCRGNTEQALPLTPNNANSPHNQPTILSWTNAIAFGNGVESDRIRDDFNADTISNGVKASTVLAIAYNEERRKAGLIHSGIYNSTSGVNSFNQFLTAEKITKDMNPQYGSIQKLHTRDNNIVVMHEDKIMKVLADKDALFNADGGSNVAISKNFLGSDQSFATNYGISNNPESFATDLSGRVYFSDRTRGAVLRLSNDGITNISDYGMKDWFNDHLNPETTDILGSFDQKKGLYNITIKGKRKLTLEELDDIDDNGDNDVDQGCGCEDEKDDHGRRLMGSDARVGITSYEDSEDTLSFSENSKGWISFKSFIPESGVSINNEYYTFKDGEMFQHHSNTIRNSFYGDDSFDSRISVLFNDDPSAVKSFSSLNYEGTQARITPNSTDSEYYNLNSKKGWYVEDIVTNLQTTDNLEFKDKEGKYFTFIKGNATTLGNLDETEFSVQGIGSFSEMLVSGGGGGERITCLTITPTIDCNPVPGCTDPKAENYDVLATVDDGSCTYPLVCDITVSVVPVDPAAPGFNSTGIVRPANAIQLDITGGTTSKLQIVPLNTTNAWSGCNIYSEVFNLNGSMVASLANQTNGYSGGNNGAAAPWTVGVPHRMNSTLGGSFGGQPMEHKSIIIGPDCQGTFYFRVVDLDTGCEVVSSFTIQALQTTEPHLCVPSSLTLTDPTAHGNPSVNYHSFARSGDINGAQDMNNHTSSPTALNGNYAGPYEPFAMNPGNTNIGSISNASPTHSVASLYTWYDWWHSSWFGSMSGIAFQQVDVREHWNWILTGDMGGSFPNNNGYKRIIRWYCNPQAVEGSTWLAQCYDNAISEFNLINNQQSPISTNTIVSSGKVYPDGTAAPDIIQSAPTQVAGGCVQHGRWSGKEISLFSYEQCVLLIRFMAEQAEVMELADNGTSDPNNRLQAIQYLKNATLSTPWYGPAFIDINGQAIDGKPGTNFDNYLDGTPYAIDGLMQMIFDSNDTFGTWTNCTVKSELATCFCGETDSYDSSTGVTTTCDASNIDHMYDFMKIYALQTTLP